MYPNENQPIDPNYLDQIAPQPSQKINIANNKPIFIAIIGLVITLFIFFIGMIASGLSGSGNQLERLSARLTATEGISVSATTNIKNSKLRALNSNLKIYLTNTIRDITPLLAVEKIDVKKLDKKIIASESNEKILAKLEDARLNAIYDRSYARELSYQLETTMSLMRQIYNKTKNKDLKTFLEESYNNLEPIQKQFSDFNTVSS